MSGTGEAQLQAENSAGPAIQAKIAEATALHQQGNLADAERHCRDILRLQPNHFEALHLLGVIAMRTRHLEQAVDLFRQAIQVNATAAVAHSSLGHALLEVNRPAEALPIIDQAIALAPEIAPTYFNRGMALELLQRPAEALASYDRAVELRPDYALAHCNRGNVLQMLNRYDEALASYDRSIQFRPNYALVHYNRGNVLQDLNRYAEAVASYERAYALRPDFAEAFSNRGNALLRLRRYEQSLASFDRALELRPEFADAHSNRGALLQEMRRFDEALASYDHALASVPSHSGALSNRGLSLHQLNRYDEALQAFKAAYAVAPDNPEAHFGEAQTRLLLGDFERGWEHYEWRSRGQHMLHERRSFAQPRWREGDEIAGKTVLLYGEQGFGDTIQFSRYVPLVAQRGARVILEVGPPLRSLMTGLAGAAHVFAKGAPLPDFDMQCALLSMPLMFRTDVETIPAAVPYLHAPAEGVRDWQARLEPKRRPRVGLAWSGRPAHPEDINRSIGLAGLLPLLDSDATFVSLQKGVRPADAKILEERSDLLNYAEALGDFSDTAALIANLDLVISVDTSVVHLAGALAKPVWVLLAANPDWRWMLNRDDSPWYPSVRLFRQDKTRAWGGVIARVQAALLEFIKT
ncbi:MAG: tetratricopeptide repeat protein [Pseudolabrys sp.]